MRIAAVAVTVLGVLVLASSRVAVAGAAQLYVVTPHDTLYSIARHFGVSVGTLAQANNVVDASKIRVGQVLVIPSPGTLRPIVFGSTGPPAHSVAGAEPPSPQAQPSPAPPAGRVYVVQAGDTLYHIAKTSGVTVAALQDANHLGASTTVRVGESLVVPSTAVRAAASTVNSGTSRPAAASMDAAAAEPPADAPVTLVGPDTGAAGPPHARGSLQSSLVARRITSDALRYLGTPYAWGGTTRTGVDCSGLVYAVYSPYVPDLPRVSYDQWNAGTPVEMTALAPGDLVFFNTDGTGPSHVGIYIGDGRFVHPSSGAGRVVVDDLDEPYFLSHYLGARRVL